MHKNILKTLYSKSLFALLAISANCYAAPPVGTPQGVDDFFNVDVNSSTPLNVIANDIINGSIAPIKVSAVSGIVAASPCAACGNWTVFDANNITFQTNNEVGDVIFFYYNDDSIGSTLFGTCDGFPVPASTPDDSCAIVTVTVTYIADVPNLSVNNNVNPDEDTSVNLGINASLSDLDGSEVLTISLSGLPPGAKITDGVLNSVFAVTDISAWNLASIRVKPALNDNTDFNLTVTATSTTPNADTKQVVELIAVVVNPVNDAPVAVADAYNLDEGATLTATAGITGTGVLGNDSDVDGDALIVTIVTGPAFASSFTLDPDGAFSYQHDDTENFVDSFTYTTSDGLITTAVTTVSLTINPLNDNTAVVAGILAGSVTEGDVGDPLVTATGNVSISDVDVDDSPVFNDASVLGTYGAIDLVAGAWSYTLDQLSVQTLAEGFIVLDTLTLTASDATTQDIVITITGTNDAPVAAADAYNLDEGATLTATAGIAGTGVLGNDSDVDGDVLIVTLVTGPVFASSFTLDPDGAFSYQHDDTETFVDSFTYTTSDGLITTAVTTVSLTINHLNDNTAVVAGIFAGSVTEGDVGDPPVTATGNVSISDVDVDDSPVFNDASVLGTYGSIDLVAGAWSYTLDQFSAQILAEGIIVSDTLTLTASDATTQDIVITITGANDAPVALADAYNLDEGATLTATVGIAGTGVLGNDSDVDGDVLIVTIVTGPAFASSFTLDPDGSFSYQHDDTENFVDSFTYTTSDGLITTAATTVSLTINLLDDNAPVVAGLLAGSVTEGDVADPPVIAIGNISISDLDADDNPFFADSSIPGSNGTLDLVSGTWSYTLDQTTVQSLDAGDVVIDTLILTASDGTTQDVAITITGTNDAPVISDQNVTVSENLDQDVLVTNLIVSDPDADDSFTYIITGGLGSPAEFKVENNGELLVGDHTPDVELLNFEATPAYSLTIQVTDSGGLTDTATILVNISDAADAPGSTLCEEFDGFGNSLGVLPAYLDPIRNFYAFTPATPCHRVISNADDYYMEQEKKLVAISLIPDPPDTVLTNYRNSLNDIPKNWDQDSSTLYFTAKQNVTAFFATIVFADEAGTQTESGEFVYQPPASLNSTDDGIDSFVYRVCDDPVDESESRCAFGVVYVDIEKTAAASVSANNIIANSEDLSQGPLELPVPALPNVFVLLDDSESMSSDILTSESEGYYAVGNQTKTYFLPEDGSGKPKYADSEKNNPGNGLWRLRNSEFNKVYYNPGVSYYPWIGVNDKAIQFTNSDPTGAISNPYKSASAKINLTATRNMPNLDKNVFLAKHYTWTDIDDSTNCPGNVVGVVDGTSPFTAPGGVCTEGTLVEIKPVTATYPRGTNRTDCDNPAFCTYAEEIQNFANFYSYARTRHYTAKNSLGAVVAASENMRIGFGAFGGKNDNINIEEMNESPLAGNKGDLLEHIYRNNASSLSTPIRDSLERTGRYFECLNSRTIITSGATCPVLPAPEGNCQQSFALVVTAGFWNASGPSDDIANDDDATSTDFDGGRYADSASKTLADVAMFFYERDLHPGLVDEVPVTQKDADGAPSSAFGGTSETPTMHQHMSTYVISFGVNGTIGMSDVPADYTQNFVWGDALTDDEKLNDLVHTAVNGRGDYLNANNPEELKTALEKAFQQFAQAIGTASAVSFNSQEVQANTLIFRAFYNIRENSGDLIAQNINPDGTLGSEVWSAAEALDLKTYDNREILTFDSSVVNGAGGIPFRAASLSSEQKLALEEDPLDLMAEGSPAFNDQIAKHVNYLRGDASNERPQGNLRERPDVKGRLGDIVSSTPVFYGAPDRARRNSPPYPQSDPYEIFKADNANRRNMVYVSSNDGMLHGFDADDGEEIFAYVPDHIITGDYSQRIKQLLSTNYAHRYSVDLSNAVNDVYLDPDLRSDSVSVSKKWTTILIGGYRAGGKGYFALDITDPDGLTEINASEVVMWEFTDEDDVHPVDASGVPELDAAGIPISDLGYTYSPPIIAMSNYSDPADDENEWIAAMGNGYNSTSGKAVLYVLFISKGTDGTWCHPDKPGCAAGEYDFIKIETPAVSATVSNGLGVPRAIDVDGNGTMDIAYAGDRFGNLYRFDLRDPDPEKWDATLVFQATYHNADTSLDEAQPITTRPLVVVHPTKDTGANCYAFNDLEEKVDNLCGGYIVVFATGSYIFDGDDTAMEIQSMYGVWDRLGAAVIDKSDLVQQEYTAISGDSSVGEARILSNNPVDYDTRFGWYNNFDFASADGMTDPEFPGEKAIRNIQIRGGIVFVNSVIPKPEMSCTAEMGGAANTFCPATGSLSCITLDGVFDINGDGLINYADLTDGGEIVASTYFKDSVPTDSTFIGGARVTQLSDRTLEIRFTETSGGKNTGRISWSRLKRN